MGLSVGDRLRLFGQNGWTIEGVYVKHVYRFSRRWIVLTSGSSDHEYFYNADHILGWTVISKAMEE